VLAVVVLTYDAPAGMLEACVDSVVRAGGADLVVVVDNGTAAAGRLAGRACEVVTTGRNLGFSGGMNVGIRRSLAAGADSIALLNDDAEVDPGWLEHLVAELARDPRLGAVQPKLLVAGTDPPIVNSVGVVLGRDGAGRDVGYGEPDGPAFAAARDIDLFTGGAVLLRAGFLADVGPFDERFFLYYEDVDLALRGAARGWRYRCAPASTVRHRGSTSTARVADLAAYLQERNRLRILFRYRSPADVARGLWLSVRRVRWTPRAVHARALAAGLASAPAACWQRLRAR